MYKLTLALAAFAFVAAAGGARADSSGHIDINSLSAQMPRSYDALSPVADDLPVRPDGLFDRPRWLEVWLHRFPVAAEVSPPLDFR